MSASPPPGAVRLCSQVIAAAQADDWDKVSALVRELDGTYGAPGQMALICGLADTIGHQLGISGTGIRDDIAPLWLELDSGRIDRADGVPPETAWAGRFIAARLAWDKPACDALIGAVPDDATWSRNVGALISVTALTLKRLDEEAASAGRSS